MVALALNPAVTAPRKTLTPSQLSVLRDLDRLGRAFKVRNGWKLGGYFRKSSTCAALVRHDLAREDFKDGKHVLVPTYAGRTALAMLTPDAASPRRHWQD